MRKRFYWLKKPKVRQSWNKYNLYNLARLNLPPSQSRTFFQQKWSAKAATRAYHGEQILEKQWKSLYTTRLPAVAPLDHRYLAQNDGSEQSAGRGSGVEPRPEDRLRTSNARTPYEQMTYFPMERRLDVSIFRALFASSTRQARQFVVHGFVKVNGKKMVQPGYLLNPGDMFQVEPERVLFATGANKDTIKYRRAGQPLERAALKVERVEELNCTVDSEGRLIDDNDKDKASSEGDSSEDGEAKKAAEAPSPKKALKVLQERAIAILTDPAQSIGAQRKRDLRTFKRTLRSTLSILGRTPEPEKTVGDMHAQLDALIARIQADATGASGFGGKKNDEKSNKDEATANNININNDTDKRSSSRSRGDDNNNTSDLSLAETLARIRENPPDPSKPYATPWRPRDYMSAFAFIPRYLEVNQKICSAVYLRHPVARPGLSEVPTPFHPETNQLAFTWYLRRR